MRILKHQQWHFLILLMLLIGLYLGVQADPIVLKGELLGLSGRTWFILAVLSPIIHQIFVLFCWRSELYYKGLSKLLGADAFKIYKIVFAILILSRVVTIVLLALSTASTMKINTNFAYILSGILFLPAAYLFYSVKKYFGMDRAFGLDHFDPDAFKNEAFVRKGIFRYTNNGMYIYGFLILWIPALLLRSKAALWVALFNHIYIWVHFYFTELPDIEVIYGNIKTRRPEDAK